MELIVELPTPYRLSSCAIAIGIASLNHEVFDDPVEGQVVKVAIARVRDEIFYGIGALIWEQLQDDVTLRERG